MNTMLQSFQTQLSTLNNLTLNMFNKDFLLTWERSDDEIQAVLTVAQLMNDLHKAGINVFLVLTFQWTSFDDEQLTKRVFSELKNDPKVVFLAHGEGSISSTVAFIAFKDLENYHTYLRDFRKRYGKHLQNINTLLLPSREVIKNDFTEVISLAIGE